MNKPQVHHHYVVYAIHFSLPIKPTIMGGMIPRLMDFDENFINKSNMALTPWNLGSQHLLLLGHWILMAVTKLMQDAIKMLSFFIEFFSIPKEGVTLNNIIIFHLQEETNQILFQK